MSSGNSLEIFGGMKEIFHHERVKTFTDNNWPWMDSTTSPCTPFELSMAGLICLGGGEQLSAECIICKVQINNLTQDSNPWDIHKLKSPDCEFIKLGKRKLPGDYTFGEVTTMYLLKIAKKTIEYVALQERLHNDAILAFKNIEDDDDDPEM